ncbi:MAG: hypothetical protein U9N73_12465 [Candidatus Auribacterota bacterium]|nr:hypothetical protein [Candidatus Auribacterota bacterium]
MNSYYYQEKSDHYYLVRFVKRGWILLAVGFFLGMSYLWLYSHIVDTSNTIDIFERKMSHLQDRRISLQSKLGKLQTPSVIMSRLEENNISLVDPYPEQIVRVQREATVPERHEPRSRPPNDIVILSIAR